MAVSYVAGYVDSGGSSETITLDGSGTNRVILGGIFSNQSSVNTYTGITINSTALSGITSDSVDGGIAAINGYGYLLDTDHPGAGAFTMATTPVIGGVYSAIELQGVDQTTPLGSQVVNTDTAVADGGTVSCTLTGASGSFAIVFVGSADSVETATANHGLPAGATLIGDVKNSKKNFRIGYISSVASSSETYDFTISVDGSSEVDSVIVGAIEINASGAADTVPPTYTSAPAVTATTSSGHTISQTIDEDGFVYGVRLFDGANIPNSTQVKSGLDGDGNPAPEAKSSAATGGVSVDLVFSTGEGSTAYDYWMVAEDDETVRNLQASPTLVEATTSAVAASITSVSGDDVIVDAESPVLVTWTSGATGTASPTINSIAQSNYTVTNDLNSSFEFVWPETSYGATVELAINSFTRNVSVIPQTGRSYVTLASYVEGNADITATASLVDGDQLEYDSTDTNGNTVSISALGIVTITLASGQTEPGSFDVRVISGGDRGPWQTIAANIENLGPTISGNPAPSVESGNIFQVDYTIPNMDGQTPTISGTDAGSFTFTNVSGDIWRLATASALAVGTYNVTINANDGVNPAVTLDVLLTVQASIVNGISFADLNPLVNSSTHPTSPNSTRANELFTIDILEGEPDQRQVIASIQITTDSSGNLPTTVPFPVEDYPTVFGLTYQCSLRGSAGDGFVFERTIVDVS